MVNISRRSLVQGATLGAASIMTLTAAASCDTAAEDPAGATYVLIHGSHSSSLAWSAVASGLSLRGHKVIAVDLPGHGLDANVPAGYQAPQDPLALATEGSPTAALTLDHYAQHVAAIVEELSERERVIVVGHSMGGLTLTRVGNAVAPHIERLVYVSAFCCVALPNIVAYLQTPESSESLLLSLQPVADPAAVGVTRINWRSGDPNFLSVAKLLFAESWTDAELRGLLATFQPDEPAALVVSDAVPDPNTWGSIPRSYIRFDQDRAIPLALQDRMIAEANALTPANPFDVHTLASHHMFPRQPDELIALLDRIAQE